MFRLLKIGIWKYASETRYQNLLKKKNTSFRIRISESVEEYLKNTEQNSSKRCKPKKGEGRTDVHVREGKGS